MQQLYLWGTLVFLVFVAIFFGIMSNTKQSKKAPKSLLKDEEIVFTQEDLDEELSKLKEKIDPNQPSLDHIKEAILIETRFHDLKALSLAQKSQKERHKIFPKGERQNNFNDYLRYLLNFTYKVLSLANEIKKEVNEKLGISEEALAQYNKQIQQIKYQIYESKLKGNYVGFQFQPMTLKQVKEVLNVELQIVKNGQQYLEKIKESIESWKAQQKLHLMQLFSFTVNDLVLDNYPQLSAEQYEGSKGKYCQQIVKQMQQLNNALVPIVHKIMGLRQRYEEQAQFQQRPIE